MIGRVRIDWTAEMNEDIQAPTEASADEREFTLAVRQGLRDVDEGRVRPAREALAEVGLKLGFSRHISD